MLTPIQYNGEFASSMTWNVKHNLGRPVICDVFVQDPVMPSNTVSMLPFGVVIVDDNNVTVTFTKPTAGKVRCI